MELVDTDSESPTLISNVEVMQFLQNKIEKRVAQSAKKKRTSKHFRHRDWVEEELHKYLRGTPCVQLDPDRREEFKSQLKGNKRNKPSPVVKSDENDNDTNDNQQAASTTTGFDLTEAESLQIMNMMPSELVEIHLMVDDLQSRMPETRQEEFLSFIASYKTGGSIQEDPGGGDAEKSSSCEKAMENGHVNGKRPSLKIKKEKDDSNSTGII